MNEFLDSISVGDIVAMASTTNRTNTADGSGKTAFGWTGVPVVLRTPYGDARCEAEYIPATQDHEDFIALTPIFKDHRLPQPKVFWRHTRKLNVDKTPAHEASPYARIGDDNRCETCGDIIEKVTE